MRWSWIFFTDRDSMALALCGRGNGVDGGHRLPENGRRGSDGHKERELV